MADSLVVQKHWRATFERIEKFISPLYFTDVNLCGRLYPERRKVSDIKTISSPKAIPFERAVLELDKSGSSVQTGYSFGPTWSTHWFKCQVKIPAEWKNKHVRFRWNSGCEAMIWLEGQPVQGLTGGDVQQRYDFVLTESAEGGESFCLYVEAAANGMFGAGKGGMINPPDPSMSFVLSMADVAVFDDGVYHLLMDLTALLGIAKKLPQSDHRAYDALYKANEVVNGCVDFSTKTLQGLHESCVEFFSKRNGEAQFEVHAFGHCHIDSAWLWPYSETIRKCARSWSSQLRLMDKYSDLKFVCSQMQQFAWVKEHYPTLFQAIKNKIESGQFIPVGGTWIEMDGNLPSGESFIRQFLYGHYFLSEELGASTSVFWLPDTFGYSAQLPQIAVKCGMKYFLTQKLSWSLTNKFPHNTFQWEGLDGTKILTHFPSADTYESDGSVGDILRTAHQHKDKGRSNSSMLLYGFGDGGGGPTEDMLESLKRLKDVHGVPRILTPDCPEKFFEDIVDKDLSMLCTWSGELYLELHRGTYTTLFHLKNMNRRMEFLFHDVELLLAARLCLEGNSASIQSSLDDVNSLWPKMLLNQFHDVLPGSSIELVNQDAADIYDKEIHPGLTTIMMQQIPQTAAKVFTSSESGMEYFIWNSFAWERSAVVQLPLGEVKPPFATENSDPVNTDSYLLVDVGPLGFSVCENRKPTIPVKLIQNVDCFVMENSLLRATLSSTGCLISLIHLQTMREAVSPGKRGNQFVIFDDVPLYWDAWDVMEYHLETRKALDGSTPIIISDGPLRACVQFTVEISDASSLQLLVSLDAESPYVRFDLKIIWKECHKMLKVEFPINVRSHEATYEIQFGHVKRPTHFNTSWDQAKFEVCGHKWADLSEHGFGVSLLNTSSYGHATLGNTMYLSLLRSPKAPDANADMGVHEMSYAVMPHSGTFQDSHVLQHAYNFNNPLVLHKWPFAINPKASRWSMFQLSNDAIILETVKIASRASNCIVVRLYEAFGGHSKTTISSTLRFSRVARCNMLEKDEGASSEWCGSLDIELAPFEILTLKFYFN